MAFLSGLNNKDQDGLSFELSLMDQDGLNLNIKN